LEFIIEIFFVFFFEEDLLLKPYILFTIAFMLVTLCILYRLNMVVLRVCYIENWFFFICRKKKSEENTRLIKPAQ